MKWTGLCVCVAITACASAAAQEHSLIGWSLSAKSGAWSDPAIWQDGKVPKASARVQIGKGHRVVYDVTAGPPIRMIHVAGTLSFARDRNTTLEVGLLRIQPGDHCGEEGFECAAIFTHKAGEGERPALEVGTPNEPIPPQYTAKIRLALFEGMDKESLPALVCCGGSMHLHGAPMSRTWLKLGNNAAKGDTVVTLSEKVTGWKAGDRAIVTATRGDRGTGGTRRPNADDVTVETEERIIKNIDGVKVTLDRPLEYDHSGTGDFRGAVANLSRNVIVESADPNGVRGHTMYHVGSAGAISYAELRHLGKENVLGRYSIHYHLAGNTMRGSYVIGASVWDSHNRWITIHGTNYLVVRDCVGYQSVGHGFFLEDGTEVFNVLDRNLAVQAYRGKRLPKQVLPFDPNDGAGFWWANSLNTFTRNVACENDRYGFRFEATQGSNFKATLDVLHGDGEERKVDIRTLPFVRFDDNEAHCDGRYGVNIGEGVNRVGPDEKHPFIVRNLKIWEVHYAFRPQSPSLLAENLTIHHADYGIYHPNYDRHVYRNLTITDTQTEPFNRGHDDDSVQYGPLVVDGANFTKVRYGGTMPIIQITDNNPTGNAEAHFRNIKVEHQATAKPRPLVDLGGGPRRPPKTERTVPVYLHDHFGPGRHAKIVGTKAPELASDGLDYKSLPPVTGGEARIAEVKGVPFPNVLNPIDDLPPTTVITHVLNQGGKLTLRGVAADNGTIVRVLVNGQQATALQPNFAQWQVTLPLTKGMRLEAHAEDNAGNVERMPHVLAGIR